MGKVKPKPQQQPQQPQQKASEENCPCKTAEQQRREDKRIAWRMRLIKWVELMQQLRDLEATFRAFVKENIPEGHSVPDAQKSFNNLYCELSDCVPLD